MYGIYANIGGILMVNVTIYSSTMDPSWECQSPKPFEFREKWDSPTVLRSAGPHVLDGRRDA